MVHKRYYRRALLCAFCLLSTCNGFSQDMRNQKQVTQQQTPTGRDKIIVQSDLVLLAVTVRDRNGNLVSGLKPEDFQVFDDQVEQAITAFADEGLPISLVILVDSDTKWKEGTPMAKSLVAIAGGLSATDEAMVCRYDMLFYPGNKFLNVSDGLIDELEAVRSVVAPSPPFVPQPMITDAASTSGPPPVAAPTYAAARTSKAMDDALFSAAKLLLDRGTDRRKIILIVSDGRNEPRLNHHPHDEVMESLLRANITVYSLAIGADGPKRQFSGLVDYATATGGNVFYAKKGSAMAGLYPQMTEQARHEYTIAYVPKGNLRDSSFHEVRVTVTPGLTATTRKGYYTNNVPAQEH